MQSTSSVQYLGQVVDTFQSSPLGVQPTKYETLPQLTHYLQTARAMRPLTRATLSSIKELVDNNTKLFYFSFHSRPNVPEVQAFFKAVQSIDTTLYYQTVVSWAAAQDGIFVYLDEVFSEQELLELAPFLTTVMLQDCDDRFVSNFLERTRTLKILLIVSAQFTGEALSKLPPCKDPKENSEGLKELIISGSTFNYPIPERSSLEVLRIISSRYNQPLPQNLPNLRSLHLYYCSAFNQPLPSNMPKLESFQLRKCTNFTHPLPDKTRLKEFYIEHN